MATPDDDQLLGIVDAEIAQLRLRLSALCSKRNALMPVARLPPELMSIIFLYARDSCAPNSRSKMVLIISWICRTWRRNSLDFSQLWSEIDFHHHMGIKKFLTRSRQSPLSIKLNYSYLVLRNILGLPQCSRIQSFDLNKDSFVEKRPRHLDLDEIYSAPTPSLQFLSLRGTTLPTSLIKFPPPLKHLQLHYCSFEWDFPSFTGLTTLSITNPAFTIPLSSLLLRLANLPLLTELTLTAVLSTAPDSAEGLAQVQLSKLEDLTINENDFDSSHTLMGQLSVSSGASISLAVANCSEPDPTLLLEAIRHSRSLYAPITSLITRERPGTWGLEFFEQPPNSGPVHTALALNGLWIPSVLSTAFGYLDLQSLEELKVARIQDRCDPPSSSFRSWSEDFGELPNIRRLTVCGDAAYNFLEFLRNEGNGVQDTLECNAQALQQFEDDKGKTPAQKKRERREFFRSWFQGDWGSSIEEPEESTPDQTGGDSSLPIEEPEEFTPEPISLSFPALREVFISYPRPDRPDVEEEQEEEQEEQEEEQEEQDFAPGPVDEHSIVYNLRTRFDEGIGLDALEFSGWPISDDSLDEIEQLGVVIHRGFEDDHDFNSS